MTFLLYFSKREQRKDESRLNDIAGKLMQFTNEKLHWIVIK